MTRLVTFAHKGSEITSVCSLYNAEVLSASSACRPAGS